MRSNRVQINFMDRHSRVTKYSRVRKYEDFLMLVARNYGFHFSTRIMQHNLIASKQSDGLKINLDAINWKKWVRPGCVIVINSLPEYSMWFKNIYDCPRDDKGLPMDELD